MKTERLPYKRVQEIAREVTEGYTLRDLPKLEDVSWAFW